MNNNNLRNDGLDILKCICCLVVILIHTAYSDVSIFITKIIDPVPIFFVISGYFSFEVSKERIVKRAKHVFNLLVKSALLYLVFIILIEIHYHRLLLYLTDTLLKTKTTMEVLLLNSYNVVRAGHLWYLPVLVECYIILFLVLAKGVDMKLLYKLIPTMIMFHYICRINENYFSENFNIYVGWLVMAGNFQFFLLGNYIAYKKKNLDRISSIYIIIVALVCLFYKAGLFSSFISNSVVDFIVYYFAVITYFLIAVRTSKINNRFCSALMYIGRNCSMYIYVIHIIIYIVAGMIFNHLGYYEEKDAIMLVTILCSILAAIGLDYFKMIILKIKGKNI